VWIEVKVRLDCRGPLESGELLDFFARRAVAGVEQVAGETYRRSVGLAGGPAVVELIAGDRCFEGRFRLADGDDSDQAISICRAMLDLDTDVTPIVAALGDDPVIGERVRAAPGRRVPGTADPHELAIRAVLGQQVSLEAAATLAARLVDAYGEPLPAPVGSITHLFPAAIALAGADRSALAMPESRRRALLALARALAGGDLVLDGPDRAAVERALLAVPGIGPWTVAYIAMRALRDPDAFPATDLGIGRALAGLGHDGDAAGLAESWRPFRAYAAQHLWASPI
jgi:AraC family transcriptional regulator, regulatory protein of adaptative response / DNA-3-methyladenine glycosylase II